MNQADNWYVDWCKQYEGQVLIWEQTSEFFLNLVIALLTLTQVSKILCPQFNEIRSFALVLVDD